MREYKGDFLMASMSTHCITERVRLAAKASAINLAPSSLILLLWRLWRQGRDMSPMEHIRAPNDGLNPTTVSPMFKRGQQLNSVTGALTTICLNAHHTGTGEQLAFPSAALDLGFPLGL